MTPLCPFGMMRIRQMTRSGPPTCHVVRCPPLPNPNVTPRAESEGPSVQYFVSVVPTRRRRCGCTYTTPQTRHSSSNKRITMDRPSAKRLANPMINTVFTLHKRDRMGVWKRVHEDEEADPGR